MRLTLGPNQLGRNGQTVGQRLSVDVHRSRRSDSVFVLRFHDSEVRGPGHAPHWVLDVVALAVRRPVLLGETEGGFDVRTHLRKHRVLDGNALDSRGNFASSKRITEIGIITFYKFEGMCFKIRDIGLLLIVKNAMVFALYLCFSAFISFTPGYLNLFQRLTCLSNSSHFIAIMKIRLYFRKR
jgi:hypothetical protein